MDTTRTESEGAKANLGLWDAASIIVGIIIGVGIFELPQEIFKKAPGPWQAMLVWTLGGILAMVGALCFAELSSAYPRSGGEYVYLSRAYGSLTGFLYGWAQLAVIRPASIGALAYIFASHARHLVPASPLLLAIIPVVVLTIINILGVTLGAGTQNLLTAAKVLGLAGLVVFGLFLSPELHDLQPRNLPVEPGWFFDTMVLVLWAYAGWNEAAYIASEVKNSRRNLPLALILGTLTVMAIYLLVNGSILLALGFEGARLQKTSDVLRGGPTKNVFHVIIMISALGAINGMIFTTARIHSACGEDHRLFKSLSHWSRIGTPVRALVIQGILNVVYLFGAAWASSGIPDPVLVVGTAIGLQGSMDMGPVASAMIASIVAHAKNESPLDFWIYLTAPVFWFFFLLTGLSLLVLRLTEPATPRPFRAPLYPFLPLVFCCCCGCMMVASIVERPRESFFGFFVLLAGLPFYFLPRKKRQPRHAEEGQPLVETPVGPPS